MASIAIKCPKTGQWVPTGMGMDKESFKTAAIINNSFGPCPACGGTHTWSKQDAKLLDD